MSGFDPTDTKAWARAFARHVYTTGGPLREAPKHAQRKADGDKPAVRTWGDIGRRMFPEDFDRELAWWEAESGMTPEQAVYQPRPTGHQDALVAEICEFMDVGDENTVFEICQMLTAQSGDEYWSKVDLHAYDLHYTLAIYPDKFQLAPARTCAVRGKPTRAVWRRIA